MRGPASSCLQQPWSPTQYQLGHPVLEGREGGREGGRGEGREGARQRKEGKRWKGKWEMREEERGKERDMILASNYNNVA